MPCHRRKDGVKKKKFGEILGPGVPDKMRLHGSRVLYGDQEIILPHSFRSVSPPLPPPQRLLCARSSRNLFFCVFCQEICRFLVLCLNYYVLPYLSCCAVIFLRLWIQLQANVAPSFLNKGRFPLSQQRYFLQCILSCNQVSQYINQVSNTFH